MIHDRCEQKLRAVAGIADYHAEGIRKRSAIDGASKRFHSAALRLAFTLHRQPECWARRVLITRGFTPRVFALMRILKGPRRYRHGRVLSRVKSRTKSRLPRMPRVRLAEIPNEETLLRSGRGTRRLRTIRIAATR